MIKSFDIKDVYSWANWKEAKQYIGKECFFGDTLAELQGEINSKSNKILKNINNRETVPTQCIFNDDCGASWGLCIPTDKVKEVKELKYRPFRTTEEFSKVTGKRIGSILKFRCGGNDKRYYTKMYTGFHILENGNIYIELGSEAYNLEQLYNYYEWLDKHGKWQPFGVFEDGTGES